MARNARIGELRWLVTLATRRQEPQTEGTGIDEPWVDLMETHAAIEALNPSTYWAGGAAVGAVQQTDFPVSHMIRMRWVNVLDNTQAIRLVTRLPSGQQRIEVFRVRRYQEVEGRKRFVNIECQKEETVVR